MTDEHKNKQRVTRPAAADDTSWATVARDALASTSELTAIPPQTLARLLLYEARDAEAPVFSLLIAVKSQATFWSALLDALKAGAITTGGQPDTNHPDKETS